MMLNHGLNAGESSAAFVKGTMVLIPKSTYGQQSLTFGSPQYKTQSRLNNDAYLSQWRNGEFHLLSSWILEGPHKSYYLDVAQILLKLDMVKAFDRLEWHFIIMLMRHIGLGPHFISYFTTISKNASSAIRINGKLMTPFKI